VAHESTSQLRQAFISAVHEHFGFLCDHYHFQIQEDKLDVIFTSKRLSVRFLYEPRLAEIEIVFQAAGDRKIYPLAAIVEFESPQDAKSLGLMVDSSEDIRLVLSGAATLMQRHGDQFLSGRAHAFAALRAHCLQRNHEFIERDSLRRALADATQAWEAQNYRAVIAALEPMEGSLSPSQRAKLQIARKRATRD
jgi:hypothetical protein